MTTTTVNEVALKPLPTGHYSFIDLVRSEWTKIRSVRSTIWTMAITIILGIGSAPCHRGDAGALGQYESVQPSTFDAPATSLIGLLLAQFSVGVLGVLAVSAEYSTGTIRATFSAAPNRQRVYGAKILVFGVLSLIVAEFTSFVAFFLGQFLLSAPATHATLSSPGALRAVIGGGLFICLLGLLALGLGTIIRHTAGAISALLGFSSSFRSSCKRCRINSHRHTSVPAGEHRRADRHDESRQHRLRCLLAVDGNARPRHRGRGAAHHRGFTTATTRRVIPCVDAAISSNP